MSIEASTEGETLTAFAARHGFTKQRASNLKKRGLPVLASGRVNSADADRWLVENLDHRKRHGNGLRAEPGSAKDRKDEADASIRELELAKRRGELVERAAVDKAVFELARRERDSWLSWAAQSAPDLAAALGADEVAVFTELDAMVRRHLESLSEPLAEGLDNDG